MLAVAPSRLFRVYYFRLYLALILLGAFVGLAALPVYLSYWGPAVASTPVVGTRVHTYGEEGGGDGRVRNGDASAAAVRRRRRRKEQAAGADSRKGMD